jgi:hypothetical protein
MTKVTEIMSLFTLLKVYSCHSVVESIRFDLHLHQFYLPIVLPQSLQLSMSDIEIQILDSNCVLGSFLRVFINFSYRFEFEWLDDDPMRFLSGNNKVFIVLLYAKSHGLLSREPKQDFAGWSTQSVAHHLQMRNAAFRGVELRVDEFLSPVEREVVPVGHELPHWVDGVEGRGDYLRTEAEQRVQSADHNYN